MKAIVVEQAGGPEVLQIRDVPKPEPREGWVLVRVKAFGLNRAELITRSGGSPTVKFPRVIGIECVGIVEAAPGSVLQPGQKGASVMGDMGREFDGGKVFPFHEIVDAHRYMEANYASGKVVVMIDDVE